MRSIKSFFLFVVFSASVFSLRGQPYAVSGIPESLKESSRAVIRENSVRFSLKDATEGTESRTLVITVLGQDGREAAEFSCHTNMFSSLKKFSGEIFDANGRSVRKIREGDLAYSDYFSGLASDTRLHYYVPTMASYPYTIRYDYEIAHKNGIIAFPVFVPVPSRYVALEKAVYQLTVPASTGVQYRTLNTELEPEVHTAEGRRSYEWTATNVPAYISEPYSAPLYETLPLVYISPETFHYAGRPGTMTDWQEYAKWQWKLLEGRDGLPDALRAQVVEMTRNAATDREKIRLLYDFLAATTRYVSIQIGVGGLQPMTAAEVYANKFGDCKALTYYMQALLKACGIDSYYTEIGVTGPGLLSDFASPYLSDHAILQVPLDGETLWLECTAPELPFGYVHASIAGRPALVYRDGTARIVEVGAYPDSLNRLRTQAELFLTEDGGVRGNVSTERRLYRYEEYYDFTKLSTADQQNRLLGGIGLSGARIGEIRYSENKEAIPSLTVDYELSSFQFGSASGSRIFIPVSPLRRYANPSLGRVEQRRSEIRIERGTLDEEAIVLQLPENVELEGQPAPLLLETVFGTFELRVEQTGHTLTIFRSLLLRSGKYDPGEFEAFKEFLERYYRESNGRLVLKKS